MVLSKEEVEVAIKCLESGPALRAFPPEDARVAYGNVLETLKQCRANGASVIPMPPAEPSPTSEVPRRREESHAA